MIAALAGNVDGTLRSAELAPKPCAELPHTECAVYNETLSPYYQGPFAMRIFRQLLFLALCFPVGIAAAAESDIFPLIDTIKRVDKHGVGHADAVAAVKRLQQADGSQLTGILRGMDDAGPLAANWLRGAFETVAERQLKANERLPVDELEAFVRDTKHGDRSRRLAYEWLVRIDSSAADRLLPTMLDDPSLELRHDAIEQALEAIHAVEKTAAPRAKLVIDYRRVLGHARDLDQIKTIVDKLKGLDAEVDLQQLFGFVVEWKLIGPFDNTDGKGFAAVYPPESEVNFAAHDEGKWATVRWLDHATADPHGIIDLNKALGKHKAAVAYAAAEFTSDIARPVELRMGCINACKVWLNGELIIEREVYHTAVDIDQYAGKGQARAWPQCDPGQSVPERSKRGLGTELAVPTPRLRQHRRGSAAVGPRQGDKETRRQGEVQNAIPIESPCLPLSLSPCLCST